MGKVWALPWALFALGCAGDAEPITLGEHSERIVYGADDRRELYEAPSDVRERGRAAVVALVPKARIQRPATGEVKLTTVPLGIAYGLCEGERFREEPTAADCTGVLIDDDLLLTAGHCFEDVSCSDYLFVFDYFYQAAGQLEPIGSPDIYACRELVAHEISSRNGRMIDYAVVQLDRRVPDRKPVSLREQPANANEPLVVLGMGSGLPLKVDMGARTVNGRSADRDFFMLEADTFEGSSGSAILDTAGGLLGVLVRGGKDYVKSATEDCQRVNRVERAQEADLPDGDLGHEEATYATAARAGVCDSGFPSARLCGATAKCGDGFCTGQEDRNSCAEDCDPCEGDDCGARGSLRFSARDAVKQSAGSGRIKHASCTLTTSPNARLPGWEGLGALSTLLALRRRRSAGRAC